MRYEVNELYSLKLDILKNNKINFELAKSKGLIVDDDFSVYALIQAFYRKVLESYILNVTNLNEFNSKLQNSDLDFGVISCQIRNSFHITSYLDLDYIYFRNFLFIEKLSVEELQIFRERILTKNFVVDELLLSIVRRTFRDVINDNYRHGEYKQYATSCYGTVIPINFVDSDALTFVVQYGRNRKKLSQDDFHKNLKEKEMFLDNLQKNMEESLSKQLQAKVVVLVRTFVDEV